MHKVLKRVRPYIMPLVLFAGFAQAALEGPESVVRQASDKLYRALQQECPPVSQHPERLFELVDEILLPHADFRRMSRWVMGKHWNRSSEAQRQQFMHEFRMLLVRTYATAVQNLLPENIRYLPVRASGKPDKAVVRTELRQPGEPVLPINYHLYRKDGHWLVYDVRIEDISLVSNYRSSFAAEIRAKGVQGLIDEMKQKNQRRALNIADNAPSAQLDSC